MGTALEAINDSVCLVIIARHYRLYEYDKIVARLSEPSDFVSVPLFLTLTKH